MSKRKPQFVLLPIPPLPGERRKSSSLCLAQRSGKPRSKWWKTNWHDPADVGTWGLPPCGHSPDDFSFDHGGKQPESVYRDAMGCDWMTVAESREAIPPAYTEHVGSYLLAEARARVAA